MRTKENDPKHVHGLAGVPVRAALAFLVGCAVVVGMQLSSPSARAATPTPVPLFHGMGLTKNCNSPTVVGSAYICSFKIQNLLDDAHDTMTITSLVDVVHSGSGGLTPVPSGNLLPLPTVLTKSAGASCNPTQTLCTIPFGESIQLTTSFYNVQPGDPNPITDTGTLTFQDLCTGGTPTPDCPLGQTLYAQAGAQSEVQTPTPTPTNTFTPTPTPTNTFTPTPTATRPNVGVGGAVKLPPAAITAESGASDSGWPVAAYLGAAGAVLAISVGGWYARRRWLA